jgi:hypothetical protein
MNILKLPRPWSASDVSERAAPALVPRAGWRRAYGRHAGTPIFGRRRGRIELRAWAALLFCAIWTTGCNTTEKDWNAAKETDTTSAYTGFLTQHPQGPHADEARTAIESLDWKEAHSANTSVAYTAFLVRHPQEAHAADAKAAKAAAESVTGRTYVTSDGDTIVFQANGRATERNGNPGIAYAGQAIFFGADGRSPRTACTYTQNENKIALACDEGAKAVYTINTDGSLEGPTAGMFRHTAFAHLTEQK